MFKINKKFLITGVLAFICMGLTSLAVNDIYLLGQKVKDIKTGTNNDVVAEVNGEKITKENFEMAKALQNDMYTKQQQRVTEAKNQGITLPSPVKKTDTNVLNDLIENRILYLEAQMQGVSISYDGAKKIMEAERKMMLDAVTGKVKYSNMDEVKSQYEDLQQYIKGLGMTEDQYWTSTIPQYQESASIANLKKKIISSMSSEDRKNFNTADAYFNQYYKDILKTKYEIKIYSDNLK